MSWFNVWDGLKNKTCRYLLQRYLGQFLEEKLNLDQLNVELYNGKAMVKDVALKVEALNELFEAQGWAFEVIGGHIGTLTATVPWNALMTNNSSIEISDLYISLRPTKRKNDGTSMLESMWSSVSSSMQLAEECMKQNDFKDYSQESNTNAIIGLEKFAETIDNVLNRINAKFHNTVVRLEYLSKDRTRGIAIICKIENLDYKNETGYEKGISSAQPQVMQNLDTSENVNLFPAFAKHNISITGLRICTEEFMNSGRTYSDTQNFLKSFCLSNHVCESNQDRSCSFEGCHTKQIPIMDIKGEQKVQIKMKQSEEIMGPKVLLDVEFGSIYSFLTPRQIHLLVKLWDAFQDEEETNTFCKTPKNNWYQSSQNNNYSYHPTHMTGVLGNHGNWTEGDDDISKANATSNVYADNCLARADEYCDSLNSSMSSSTYVSSSTRFQRKMANMDTCSEILNFNIRISSISIFIPHEDILVESNTNRSLINEKSLYDMYQFSDSFFNSINGIPYNAEGKTKCNINEKNHIFLCMSPITAEGVQQRNRQILVAKFSLASTKVDLFEVLEGVQTPIILFDRKANFTDGYQKQPEMTLNLKTSSSYDLKERSITSIDIRLEKNTVELDVSIYDRLSYLLASSPFDTHYAKKSHESTARNHRETPSAIDAKILCETLSLKLRFPIVDARPIYDSDRTPWWKQNVRADFLLFTLYTFSLKYTSNSTYITANEIDVFYCEKDEDNKVHLVKTCLNKDSTNEIVLGYPSITITTPHISSLNDVIKTCPDESDSEESFGMCSSRPSSKLPFSSKRECRQSDTVHIKRDAAESETILLPGDTEEINKFCDLALKTSKVQVEISLPIIEINLESKQLYEVIYNRLNTDLFMWEPSSPIFKVNVFDEKSELQQSLFNVSLTESVYFPSASLHDPYKDDVEPNFGKKFKNKQRGETISEISSSGSDESSIDVNENDKPFSYSDYPKSIYYSTHNSSRNKQVTKKLKPSNCSVSIEIKNGLLSLFVPVRDMENHVLPGQLGKFQVKINALKFFIVSGYNNNSNLGYVCLRLTDFQIYHCGCIPVDSSTSFNCYDADMEHFMQPTFYKIPPGLTKGNGLKNENRELISIVIELRKLPEQHVKRLRMTAGIQKTVLRHNPTISSHIWLNQLIDFLDVVDYPIEGYKPFGVITEIQLHLWDCAIDYRPKRLSYRAVVEFGSFTISSNIISSVTGCNLRFVVEECILSLAPFNDSYTDHEYFNATKLPSSDLVPILDVGLFDVSLRLNEKIPEKFPKFDLRCSIHDVHLRTCSDSASALAQMIAYIANEGDVINEWEEDQNTESFKSSNFATADIFSQDESSSAPEISKEQQERVNLLMAEAVQDTKPEELAPEISGLSSPYESGIEVYYFPDENTKAKIEQDSNSYETQSKNELCDILHFESNVMLTSYFIKSDVDETLPQVKADLGDVKKETKYSDGYRSSQDEDYCIIADEEKSFMAQCGIKDVKILDDPLRIVDNHFYLPTGKPDLLKPPENFPTAMYRYTLCEMTFTWHMYGGKDFPNTPSQVDEKNTKTKTEKFRMSNAYKYGVSYSKCGQAIQFGKKPKEKITWKTIGGPDRNHEVLVEMQFSKIRFSHEIYPKYMSHASRQVLLVNEIEIRDRLQTSDINKFLYHPNIRNLSNKSPQHMIVIKALHVRPNPKKSTSQECSLRISLLPLRLNIDQDTLIFLTEYFTNIGEICSAENSGDHKLPKQPSQYMQAPVMTVDEVPEAVQDLQARRLVTTNLDLLMEDENSTTAESVDTNVYPNTSTNEDSSPIYFREVIFSPDVSIRFDYHGRRVDLSRGPIAGLLMGLGQLQCSEILLKKIEYRRGLLGVEKLFTYLCKEWLKDIKSNQLQKILSGVGPTHAFVQLFQGIYDLFWLPIEQYQKDGRLIRGLQLGAQSFTARTALAALEITSRIIQLLQFTAETAFDMVSPGPSVRRSRKLKRGKRKRPNRPKDIREGVTNAYLIVKEGINDSANNLIETAVAQHDQKGYTGAVGAVMRQIPQLVVCPAVLATQATTNILGGVKNSLVPEAKIEAREKWKDDSD